MEYVGFLKGNDPDDKGRYYEEIIGWGDFRLEVCHDYIQRVFPTDEQSRHSSIRPVIEREVHILLGNPAAAEHMRAMYKRMLRFWQLDGDRYYNWHHYGKRNHNYLRMTRVLQSLALFRMEKERADLQKRLQALIDQDRVSDETKRVWESNFTKALC